uniref:Peptidoglycan recognition protein family domain-containing protein n=1 Tax=Oryzias melastigma TaxID=30732 RepID=A0A3B3DRN0_ORYME
MCCPSDVFIPDPIHPGHSQREPQHPLLPPALLPVFSSVPLFLVQTTWLVSPQSCTPFLSFVLKLFCHTSHLTLFSTHSNLDDMIETKSCSLLHIYTFFVVGSDGYIYEGRGWTYRGSHTRGRNSVGYGVAVIGNYTASLPSRHATHLLRDRLAQCAVDGGALAANFSILGHRQVVNYTTCPGDAFFDEIKTWKHFRE